MNCTTFKTFYKHLFFFTLYVAIPECDLTLAHLLKFVTGVKKIPPLGFSKKIDVHFRHGCQDQCKCRPSASTCFLYVRLPVHYQTSEDITFAWLSALKDCQGFGQVWDSDFSRTTFLLCRFHIHSFRCWCWSFLFNSFIFCCLRRFLKAFLSPFSTTVSIISPPAKNYNKILFLRSFAAEEICAEKFQLLFDHLR